MKLGKPIWVEDECTIHDKDHETLGAAWQRLYGHRLSFKDSVSKENLGDCQHYLMLNGKIVQESYPGNNGIYELDCVSPCKVCGLEHDRPDPKRYYDDCIHALAVKLGIFRASGERHPEGACDKCGHMSMYHLGSGSACSECSCDSFLGVLKEVASPPPTVPVVERKHTYTTKACDERVLVVKKDLLKLIEDNKQLKQFVKRVALAVDRFADGGEMTSLLNEGLDLVNEP